MTANEQTAISSCKSGASKCHTNILFAGDFHGVAEHAGWVFNHALATNSDVIVQVGDHGYWPHERRGQSYVDAIAALVECTGVELMWIDGNHDNHDVLATMPRDADGLVTIAPGYRYIPRNTRFDLGGITFLGHGGALSVDRDRRVLGESWWTGETVTRAEVDAVMSHPVDVLLTHEAPGTWPISYKDDIAESVAQRTLVSEIACKVAPRLVVHGHHHTRYTHSSSSGPLVIGLGRDGQRHDSVWLLDTEAFRGMSRLSNLAA